MENNATNHFADEIDRLVDRFRDEYDAEYAQIVGVLFMKAWMLCAEACGEGEEL